MSKITYIAGRQLKIGDRVVEPGEEVDGSIFPRIEALLNSGRLYAVTTQKEVDALPRHLYKAVMTRKAAKEKIEGDPTHLLDDESQETHKESEEVRLADAQAVIRREGPSAFEKAQAVRLGRELTDEEKAALPKVKDVQAQPEDENQSQEEEFDPSEHTVDEVKEYLEANPEDAERVLEAEKAGKNRKSLVE